MRAKSFRDVWNSIDVRGEDECWPYLGAINHAGYGVVKVGQSQYLAHRIAYSLTHPGTITPRAPQDRNMKAFVLHKCDNPPCCNPSHLFVGNLADNNRDASAKGRSRGGTFNGERRWNAKLRAHQVDEIRWLGSLGLAASEIAPLYRVCNQTVQNVIARRRYA